MKQFIKRVIINYLTIVIGLFLVGVVFNVPSLDSKMLKLLIDVDFQKSLILGCSIGGLVFHKV